MKTLAIILLLSLGSFSALSQSRDSVLSRYAIVVDYDGSLIDQFGFKYRTSHSFSLYARFTFRLSDISNSEPGYDPYKNVDFRTTLGAQYLLMDVSDLSLYASLSLSYGSNKNEVQRPFGIDLQKSTNYSIAPGVTVEYFFSERFSLGASQFITFSRIKTLNDSSNPADRDNTQTRKLIEMGPGYITLSFYL